MLSKGRIGGGEAGGVESIGGGGVESIGVGGDSMHPSQTMKYIIQI